MRRRGRRIRGSRGIDQLLREGFVADVAGAGTRRTAHARNRFDDRVELPVPPRRDDHFGAVAREEDGSGLADTGAGPRDDGDFVRQQLHGILP